MSSNPEKNIKKFWTKFEQFLGSKVPLVIKTILIESGFDDELVLQTLNEKAIEAIEEKVVLNPNVLIGSVYENSKDNFHFLLGHRLLILILDFANKAREFAQTKKIGYRKKAIPVVAVTGSEIDANEIIKDLLTRLNAYSQNSGFNFAIQNKDIVNFRKVNDSYKCKVHCPVNECTFELPCIFYSRWSISNFTNHVKRHYRIISIHQIDLGDIQRLNTENNDLDDILR